jgi:SAM-dependent methyltransferase
VLDFGSGTGIDAEWYDQQGYRVLAFDSSEQMMARLRDRCRAGIDAGRIETRVAPFSRFEGILSQWPPPNALVANFAVLNMIEKPQRLFEMFASQAAAPSWLIVSIVNPTHWRYLKRVRWWLDHLAYRRGRSRIPLTLAYRTFAHFPSDIVAAACDFELIGIADAGTFVRYSSCSPKGVPDLWWGPADGGWTAMRRLLWARSFTRLFGTFVFMVMRRK